MICRPSLPFFYLYISLVSDYSLCTRGRGCKIRSILEKHKFWREKIELMITQTVSKWKWGFFEFFEKVYEVGSERRESVYRKATHRKTNYTFSFRNKILIPLLCFILLTRLLYIYRVSNSSRNNKISWLCNSYGTPCTHTNVMLFKARMPFLKTYMTGLLLFCVWNCWPTQIWVCKASFGFDQFP